MSATSDKDEAGEQGEQRERSAEDAPVEGEAGAADGEAATADKGDEGAAKASRSGDEEDEAGDGADADAAEPGGADEAKGSGADSDESDDADVVAAPEAQPAPLGHPSYAFLAVVTLVTLAADLGTKIWAEGRFEGARGAARQMEVLKDLLIFRLARNKGGAWGILSGESPTLRISFFVAISIVAVGFILTLYRKTTRDQKALTWGLPLVLGGALGNLVDRIRYGEVIDFIEVHLGSYQHPTFNIADIAIVAGVGLMAIDMFTPRRRSSVVVAEKKPDA